MKTSFQTFVAGVVELLAFLTNAEREVELIGLLLDDARQAVLAEREKLLLSQMVAARTDRKRYIYCVAVVALYGLLERFVDTGIQRFVDRIAGITPTYENMPDAIKRNHVPFSMDLVRALAEERYRKETTIEEVIANLHSCLSAAEPFRVNGAAFVLHRGNISLDRITTFLASVGIDSHLRKAVRATPMSNYLRLQQPERDITNIADQELRSVFEQVDDLVERRNQVSHGVFNVDDIESIDLLSERCRFIAAYGAALYELLSQDVVQHETQGPTAQPLGKPVAVFNNSIVCFEHANCKIAVGDVLVASTGDQLMPFRFGPILSIQIENVDQTAISLVTPTQFGLRVSYRARDRYDYYVLPEGIV